MINRTLGGQWEKMLRMLSGVSSEKFSCEMVDLVAEINL